MPKPQKVVFITSGQPSINPRLVKEADALAEAGFEVTVLYAFWNNWATVADEPFLKLKRWKWVRVGGDPVNQPFLYALSRILYKITFFLYSYTKLALLSNWAIARSSFWLIREAKKHSADIYIAHNLGALPATVIAAKANRALSGFDAEDFHRGETTLNSNHPEVQLKVTIEDEYIPQVDYFTASSPQIAAAYLAIYPFLKPVVLLNVFPKANLSANRDLHPGQIKLFWLSQTIGPNRGLEDVINALHFLNNPDVELHLLGSILPSSHPILNLIAKNNVAVVLQTPLPPHEIINFCSQFDIGLALEPGFSANNNMALSNKLFTYMQAGITTIASDTLAQNEFMSHHPAAGRVYKIGDHKALAEIILFYYINRPVLTEAKNSALQLAHNEFNWESEGVKFLNLVNNTLANNNG